MIPPMVSLPPAAATWDAGDLGCGDLVMLLRPRVLALAPGEVLHVVARDPGAPADMPAWCGLTGHGLVHADHPHYFIRRRAIDPSASPTNLE